MTMHVSRFSHRAGLGLALALGLMLATPPAAVFAQGPASVADVAAPLLDAVVNISTTQKAGEGKGFTPPKLPEGSPFEELFRDFLDRQERDAPSDGKRVQSLGSGFVIDPKGLVITNNHVIEDGDDITVNFTDGTKLKAELVGHDPKTDIAVLRVKPEKPLKAVSFGDSAGIRVGDWVMAIGNPFGLGGTVTVGIVSARNRNINSGPYDDFIQTDAAINRGNSGGPLFDMDGKVIGINTAIISPSGGSIGIGFAIPSNAAKRVVEQLVQFGETRRGWIGVRIQPVTPDIAESLGLKEAKGVLIAGVTEDGPAAAAGFKTGDIVTAFDGKPVADPRELARRVADSGVGSSVPVTVNRNGKDVTLTVALGRLEEENAAEADDVKKPAAPPVAELKVLGMSLATMTPELRSRFSLADDVKGVVVTQVASGSAAADKRVQPGDVIVEVAQEPVASPADVEKKVTALKADGRRSVLLLLSNAAGEVRFVAVRAD
ncbi:DegQ family serine endoprotease [Segnochrobactraceae bacterium EtOH-i3]